MRWLRRFLYGMLALGLIWAGWSFRSGNPGVIDLDLVWIRIPNVAVWWALVMAVAAGAVLGGLVVGFAWLRQRLLNRRHRRAIERLEGELHRLRSLPLVGGHGGRFEEPATGPSVGRG
ncbi:MAG: LapA family protein [Myxococcota bacterium]